MKPALLLVFFAATCFAQNPNGIVIDCSGVNAGHRGKLISAAHMTEEETKQLKLADEQWKKAQEAHDAVINKIKSEHGQSGRCDTCFAGTDVVLVDEFVFIYKWESSPLIGW